MGPFSLSDKEREEIKKQHEEATKKANQRKEELKKGLQPKKKEDIKKPTK